MPFYSGDFGAIQYVVAEQGQAMAVFQSHEA
jgi:hypothetical protein